MNANGRTPDDTQPIEVTPDRPCPVPGCGATSGCRVDRARSKVACLNQGGPLAEVSTIRETGQVCHVHGFDPVTGRVFEPMPEETGRFLAAIFDDNDAVSLRPMEAWAEGNRKHSRVIYDAILHVPAKTLRDNPRWWARLLGAAEAEHANVLFGVCPRFQPKEGFDLAWQIRTVRVLWADLDNCTADEALKRCEAAGLPRPCVTVSSGNGVHLYWILSTPFLIDDAGDPPAIKNEWIALPDGKRRPRKYVVAPDGEVHYLYNRDPKTGHDSNAANPAFPFRLTNKALQLQDVIGGVAAKIGGDHTHDLSRLLRLPGTMNRKDARNGKPPVPCVLVEYDPARRYPISAFERFAADAPGKVKREKVAQVRLPSGGHLRGKRLDRLATRINACALADVGGRSEQDFALCAFAVEEGLDKERIWSEVAGVGKFAEKGRGYFERTWTAAQERTREKIYADLERKAAKRSPSPNGVNGHATTAADAARPDDADDPPPAPVEGEDDPHRLASVFRAEHRSMGRDTLAYWREEFFLWDGRAYAPVPGKEIVARLSASVKREFDRLNVEAQQAQDERAKAEFGPPKALQVTTKLIADVRQALAGMCLLPSTAEAPSWLGTNGEWPADEVLACRNGLMHLPSLVAGDGAHLIAPTPQFFSCNALDYAFDLAAAPPARWLSFLGDVWSGDQESIDALQEWFGYCLLPDTSQQKILMMVGPKRSGKGTVARVLGHVIGLRNVCAPTLGGLGMNFGLWPLVGKTLAIVSDARLSKRTDIAVVVERLLSISGEDAQTIDRKNLSQVTCKLATRFMILTNELPRLNDPSGALVGRMVLLRMTRSWYGSEDTGLTDRLLEELPGILLWAVEGWRRLRERGRFRQPTSSLAVVSDLEDLSSPIGAFVRENCVIEAGVSVAIKSLFEKWKAWCEAKGWKEFGKEQEFGRDLRSVAPGLTVEQPRDRLNPSQRLRLYKGVRLKSPEEFRAEAEAAPSEDGAE